MIKCKNQYLPLKILLFSGKGLICAMIVLGSSLTSFGQIAFFQNITSDDGLPKVSVIPQDIGKILHNLFNNTFYACAERLAQSEVEGSRSAVNEKTKSGNTDSDYKPTVKLSSTYSPLSGGQGGFIQLSVQDNSPGIPDSIKEKIFQPFFTTKPTGSGTRLVLSLSYDIVKAHGGKLQANSSVSEGTEMNIFLPTDPR